MMTAETGWSISRRAFAILCTLRASFSASAFADDVRPPRLRVLSYNIHHGEGTDGRLDLQRIADVIRNSEADLVALQEVDRLTGRTGKVDQPAELARLTEMQVAFGSNLALEGGGYGNAVLSRWPIARHANHLLPNTDGEQRGVLATDITLPDGRTVSLLATHLDHRPNHRQRIASSHWLVEFGAKLTAPAILAGDLNATPDSQPLAILGKDWQRANAEPVLTSPAGRPRRQIDYVLVCPASAWRVIEVRVLDEPVASDHRPLLATLELVGASR